MFSTNVDNVLFVHTRTVCLLWSQKKNVASNTHQSLIKSRERITKLLGMVIVAFFTFTSLPYSGTNVVCPLLGKEKEIDKLLSVILENLLVCGSFLTLYFTGSITQSCQDVK